MAGLVIGDHRMPVEKGIELDTIEIEVCRIDDMVIVIIGKPVEAGVTVVEGEPSVVVGVGADMITARDGAVVSVGFVPFEADIDDAGIAGCFVFGRRVGDEFDGLDLRGLKGFEIVGQIGTIEGYLAAVDIDFYAIFPTQTDVVIFVDHDAGGFTQEFEGILADGIDRPFDVDDSAIGLYFYGWFVTADRDGLEAIGFLRGRETLTTNGCRL